MTWKQLIIVVCLKEAFGRFITFDWNWVRLIYATTHHQPKYVHHHPPPAKICPPPPTTTHHQPKYIHHQPKYIHHYLPFPKKMDRHPAKAKIYSYITSFRHCFNSYFFIRNAIFLSVTENLCDKVLISSFFKFQISTTFSTFYDI